MKGTESKGEKLLIFYAGYGFSIPEDSAFGTWHTDPLKACCENHIAHANPKVLFEWLVTATEYDILFLLNCPFDVGETSLDLIPRLQQRDATGARTVQYIIPKER